MVNKSMRCVSDAAESAAMRLRSAAAEGAESSNAIGDNLSAASASQFGAVTAVVSLSDTPHVGGYELEHISSGELDGTPTRRKQQPRKIQTWLSQSRLSRTHGML